MTKHFHRLASFLLAAALLAGVFAGCGDNKSSSRRTPGATPSSSAQESSSLPLDNVNEPQAPYSSQTISWVDVAGATGFTSVVTDLKANPDEGSETVRQMIPGTGFVILKEEGNWWQVECGETTGWVRHITCLINLPDVVPSVVYYNSNVQSSLFVTSGFTIEGITGQKLYDGYTYNERLGREEFIMPVLYTMARKICNAQKYAAAEGNSLKIYEAYRPIETQMRVVNAVSALANSNETVMAGLNTDPWGINWFIATGLSNHQWGYAIDVSLVQVTEYEIAEIGSVNYPRVTGYVEHPMPTQIHELSNAAVTFTAPVTANDRNAWREATLAATMNEAAIALQKYCTDAGMTPLASEWWHFNDLDAREQILDNASSGNYILTEIYSRVP